MGAVQGLLGSMGLHREYFPNIGESNRQSRGQRKETEVIDVFVGLPVVLSARVAKALARQSARPFVGIRV